MAARVNFSLPLEGSAQVASSAAVPLAMHNAFQGHVGVGRQAGDLGRGQGPLKHGGHVTCTGMVFRIIWQFQDYIGGSMQQPP